MRTVSDSPSPVTAEFDAGENLVLNIVAHQDDDILFMNPDIQTNVSDGRYVLTVFVTAGDAGRGAAYWQERENGPRAAYAFMAGVADDWTRSTVTIDGHPLALFTLAARPTVGLLCLRLPDGGSGGFPANDYQTVRKLWENEISTINAIDGSTSYSRSSLISTLSGIMRRYRPVLIRTHDHQGRYGDGDHSDHHASAYFAVTAHRDYVQPHRLTSSEAYSIEDKPANLTEAQADRKLAIFLRYAAHDPVVCQSESSCLSGSFGNRFSRQYTIATEYGGQQNVAPLGTVTASSQNTSTSQQAAKAVDGVVSGTPYGGTGNEWATSGGRAGSWITIAWPTPQALDRVVLYDRPNGDDRVLNGTLRFSDGSTIATGALPNNSSAKLFSFPPKRVTNLRFTVDEVASTTKNVGLAEIQAFSINVAPRAEVTASSQNVSTRQQAIKAVDGYALGTPVDSTREWATTGGKEGSWLRLVWPAPQTVNRIVLYDRPNGNDQITGGSLAFSDGSRLAVPSLPNDGSALALTFPSRTITSVELMITSVSASTLNIGLAEIQVELAA